MGEVRDLAPPAVRHGVPPKECCAAHSAASIIDRAHQLDVWYDGHNLGSGVLREAIEREMLARDAFLVVLRACFVAQSGAASLHCTALPLVDRPGGVVWTRLVLPTGFEEGVRPTHSQRLRTL